MSDESHGYVSVPILGTGDARFGWRKLLAFIGPGALMSIAYVVSN